MDLEEGGFGGRSIDFFFLGIILYFHYTEAGINFNPYEKD